MQDPTWGERAAFLSFPLFRAALVADEGECRAGTEWDCDVLVTGPGARNNYIYTKKKPLILDLGDERRSFVIG